MRFFKDISPKIRKCVEEHGWFRVSSRASAFRNTKADYKELEEKVYLDILKNEYLGNFCFVVGSLIATLNKNQNNPVFYNPEYFIEKEGKLICIDSKIVLNIDRLTFPENENKRLCIKS